MKYLSISDKNMSMIVPNATPATSFDSLFVSEITTLDIHAAPVTSFDSKFVSEFTTLDIHAVRWERDPEKQLS